MAENKLVLKKACLNDLDKIHKWLNCEDILKYFGGRDKKISFKEVTEEYSPKNNPNVLMILIDNKTIGFIDIFPFSAKTNLKHGLDKNETDIYCFDIVLGETEYHNKGFGRRAVNAVLKVLFNKKNAEKVVLDTYNWHKQAIKCYEKCGFRVTRILKDHDVYEGKKVDDVFMEITKEEYLKYAI